MKRSVLCFVAMMLLAGMANAQGARNLPPRPALTGPVADLLNAIVVAINKQDKAFLDWVMSKGVDRAKAAEIYCSFGVDSKLKRALVLAQEYNIQALPTMVVDGKFLTSSDRIGGHGAVPAALDALVAKARAERARS